MPYLLGGSSNATAFQTVHAHLNGYIAFGGYSSDTSIVATSVKSPIAGVMNMAT